jgi:hypothetical protein
MRTAALLYLGLSAAVGNNLHSIRQNDRCGYADSSEAVTIAPQYDDCGEFTEGLAPVRLEGKWGYLAEKGEMAIAPRFEAADGFSEGLAFVTLDSEAKAVIDKAGKVLFRADYYKHGRFREGLAPVLPVTHWKCFDGQQIRDVSSAEDRESCHGNAVQPVDFLWGYIDTTGKMALAPRFGIVAGEFSEGLARVGFGSVGFVDHQGNMAIPANFSNATSFSEGLAAVEKDNNWGYIDKHGGWVVQAMFETAQMFEDARGLVKLDGKFGFVDSKGALIVPTQYDEALSFSEGLAAVRQGAKWGYIDPSGNAAIPLRFDSAQSFADGVAVVSSDSRLFAINKKGEAVSTRPPTLAQTFERMQTFETEPGSMGPFFEVMAPITSIYKEQLRELATQTLEQATGPDVDAGRVRTEIERRLNAAGIRFSANPDKETRPYGLIDKVEVVRPAQHPELLVVTFHFNLGGNVDSSLSLFGHHQSGWELLLREDHTVGPKWAYTWHSATPEFTHSDKDGSFVMMLSSDSDRSADGYHGIEVELFRFDGALRSHRIFKQQFTGKNHQIALDPDGFRLEVAAFTHDTSQGGCRPYPYHYRVNGDEVTRISPIALSAHDFVEEWGNLPWDEAVRWTDTKNADSLQQWHEKVRDPNGYFGGEFDARACDAQKTMWQIGVDQFDEDGKTEHAVFFTVQQTGKWDFVMKSASDKPMDGCQEVEPERDWRKQPTMFKEPTTE